MKYACDVFFWNADLDQSAPQSSATHVMVLYEDRCAPMAGQANRSWLMFPL